MNRLSHYSFIALEWNSTIIKPRYYLAFGHFFQGQILDISKLCNSIALDFTVMGTNNITVTIDENFRWTVAAHKKMRSI